MWPESDIKYDHTALSGARPEEQMRIMEAWFRARYEDPAFRTPYESAEGGYIWISGGPYDAREQLEVEFGGTVPDEVIGQLAEKLNGESLEWAPVPSPDDYDLELYDAVRENDRETATLGDALNAISSLLTVNIAGPEVYVHRRLLFANVIAAIETFLSDTFINRVMGNDILFQRYLDTEKAFQERKCPLKDALRMAAEIKAVAAKELIEMVWHNIAKVKTLYADVLHIDLGDIGPLAKAINIRHDIVHRNGRQKDGTEREISATEITDLIGLARGLAIRIDMALNPSPVIEDPEGAPF
ncbi:MAG: hypothetical protein JST11_01630 [Acidobacteria bacterium]|nr:hypothetical protein [Acidobacteriota bacterium]